MKKKSKQTPKHRSAAERQRLIALGIFSVFLCLTVGLIVYGLWVSFIPS